MWPSSALSALLLLRLHAAGASQPPQPPPYTTAYPAEMNLWDVPPPPDMKVNLRPFRLATRGTVTAVFFCLAWRATSLAERARDYQAPLGWLAKPFFVANVGAAMLAARARQPAEGAAEGRAPRGRRARGPDAREQRAPGGLPLVRPARAGRRPRRRRAVRLLGGPRRALVLADRRIELLPPLRGGSQYGYSGGG